MEAQATQHPTGIEAAYQRLPAPEDAQTCGGCGCWDKCPCLDESGWPRHWAEPGLWSACAQLEPAATPGKTPQRFADYRVFRADDRE